MGQAKKQTVTLSEDEQMLLEANIIRDLREKIKLNQEDLEKHERLVKDYMTVKDLAEFGGWKKVERIGSVKWEGATGKKMESIQDALKGELDVKFLETKINATAIFNALDYDVNLQRKLSHYGVKILRGESSTALKEI